MTKYFKLNNPLVLDALYNLWCAFSLFLLRERLQPFSLTRAVCLQFNRKTQAANNKGEYVFCHFICKNFIN